MTDTPQKPDELQAAAPAATGPASRPSRRLLLGGAGLLAATAGMGWSWWRSRTPGDAEPLASEATNGLWTMRWDTPQDTTLHMAEFRGKPVLINFWATWCPPCVEELPLLNDFYRTHKAAGWQVLGLAVDKPSAVKSFLKLLPLDFPVGLAGLSGTELGKSLGNVSGSLPYSVVLGAQGAVLQRKLGSWTAEDLARLSGLK